ncbi:nucleotidyl transferase AbiEii/AbiGii toxin family protein [Demequina sp. NBRC 110057]|uniref:nucleotidyl transferase AbiEii/AbiGii toxin family protein n=1 Tax=Demequina sp. NBRC 110057 TaxID=1570346 RepID=UPI0009FC7898|nr:nucleotidyl transferase AbiEii/AbiGii toxin family protein [Demequina sp. NBRC 110057]
MTGDQTYDRLQAEARRAGGATGKQPPTAEYVTRHVLESFLHRLTLTEHANDFVLKGGILLAVYSARRPTKDVDMNAVSSDVTADSLADVFAAIAAVESDDGVEFDLATLRVQEIREGGDYPGLRLRVDATVGRARAVMALDVSTGDPIVPAPRRIVVPRVIGEPIEMLGYAKETAIAEKGVTILERGITSTRWRDYVDIVQLCEGGYDADELLRSARAVARYRQVTLEPVTPHLTDYGAIAQPKWAAWRRKQQLEEICEANLDHQVARVAEILDLVFAHGPDNHEES